MVIGRTLGLYISGRFLRTTLSMFMSVFFLIWTLDFVELMRPIGLVEVSRTGVAAISRGPERM